MRSFVTFKIHDQLINLFFYKFKLISNCFRSKSLHAKEKIANRPIPTKLMLLAMTEHAQTLQMMLINAKHICPVMNRNKLYNYCDLLI